MVQGLIIWHARDVKKKAVYVLESWMNIDAAIIYHSVPAMTLKQAFKVGVSLDVILCIHVDKIYKYIYMYQIMQNW